MPDNLVRASSTTGAQRLALGRQPQAALVPYEERGAEMVFDLLDLPTDGTLGHAEFARGPAEGAAPGRNHEDFERMQMRQAPVKAREIQSMIHRHGLDQNLSGFQAFSTIA
ncbi:MAG: hypothetical protein WDN69_27660 [Aliidongia sp.]